MDRQPLMADTDALIDFVEEEGAHRAGEVCGELERAGRTIGERDALIAGVALAVGLPLVTSNVTHFRRVPGLRVVQARR